jgi:hypothetical protein
MLCFSCILYLEYRAAVSGLYMPLVAVVLFVCESLSSLRVSYNSGMHASCWVVDIFETFLHLGMLAISSEYNIVIITLLSRGLCFRLRTYKGNRFCIMTL